MFPLQGGSPSTKLYVDDVFSAYTYTGTGATQTINNGIALSDVGTGTTDQVAFTTPGTYQWVCPAGVTSVSVVCVGGGYAGGGALGYKNNITVTPGASYEVRVGYSGNDSYFVSAAVVKGGGGLSQEGGRSTFVGDGGGQGGAAFTSDGSACGGGGAGGYSGNGGNGGVGGSATPNSAGTSGTAGTGGGGGGGGGGGTDASGVGSQAGGGGGVGLFGLGASGNAGSGGGPGSVGAAGQGGSGGASGIAGVNGVSSSVGGAYGGGSESNYPAQAGAVRIIWPGNTRTFPSTNTGDVVPVGRITGFGGLVWIKQRSGAQTHGLLNTTSGINTYLSTATTFAPLNCTGDFQTFNSNGFSLNAPTSSNVFNQNGSTNVAWTFRKAPKFFDMVTWTGTGVARAISHSLGSVPGMIIVKATNVGQNWMVYHRANTANPESNYLVMQTQAPTVSLNTAWNNTAPTSSQFTIGTNDAVNLNGYTYVAYLFAHDASADGIIQCGSVTTVGGSATVNLGWEPQYLLFKNASVSSSWYILDSARGFPVGNGRSDLYANFVSAEAIQNDAIVTPTSTGFKITGGWASDSIVYMAIRRSNKPPTVGTQVYNAIARTGTTAKAIVTGAGLIPDMVLGRGRTGVTYPLIWDKLRGVGNPLFTNSTQQEIPTAYPNTLTEFNMNGVTLGPNTAGVNFNASGVTEIDYFFKRAPGVFDEVCYTGTGSATTVAHGLGVAPELMIVKCRSTDQSWQVYHSLLGTACFLQLNNNGEQINTPLFWDAAPTASVFTPNDYQFSYGSTYVAYLFATKAGISKIFKYTGNGTTLTVNCGFTTGARFVLIKRTDAAGDWYVWDSTRGIVAGNDPHLSLNSTATEVTGDSSIDPDTSGFIVNQVAATNVNVTSATYIGLAFA